MLENIGRVRTSTTKPSSSTLQIKTATTHLRFKKDFSVVAILRIDFFSGAQHYYKPWTSMVILGRREMTLLMPR